MQKALFISSQKDGAGKIIVALGILNILKQHYHRVGLFKPIFNSYSDKELQTLIDYYSIEQDLSTIQAVPIESAEAILANEGMEALLEKILESYQALKSEFDFVLCLNDDTDYLDSLVGIDIDIEIAKNLSAGVVGVFLAEDMSQNEIIDSAKVWESSIKKQGANLSMLFANKCSTLAHQKLTKLEVQWLEETPIFFLPYSVELSRLTLADILEHLPVELIAGDKEHIQQDIHSFKMGTMYLDRLIKSFKPNEFLITSTDRVDLLLGMLISAQSANTPINAGVLLCGEAIDNNLLKLLAGLESIPIPILYTNWHEHELIPEAVKIKPSIRIENRRKIASALNLFFENVDTKRVLESLDRPKAEIITPVMFRLKIFEMAKRRLKTILLPEIEDDRVLLACDILLRRRVVQIKLVGSSEDILRRAKRLGITLRDVEVLDFEDSELRVRYSKLYYELRKSKNITLEMAYDRVSNSKILFSTIALYLNEADGMVCGAIHSTKDTITPALQIIKTKPEFEIASSCFFMSLPTKVLVYADCAINLNPTAKELATIAIQTAQTAKKFGIEPKVAMLSYSSGDSGKGKDVQKIKEATKILKELEPSLPVVGPIQYDAAIDKEVSKIKMPNDEVAGSANIFIFPDLNTGNIAYKAVQRSVGAVAVGPIMQGLNRPINDLSRGCSVEDIIDTVAITAIQAQDS